MATAASLILFAASAAASPVTHSSSVTWTAEIAVSELGQTYLAANGAAPLAEHLSALTGAPVEAAVRAGEYRRLQSGSTLLTVDYTVRCSTNCDAIQAHLQTLATDEVYQLAYESWAQKSLSVANMASLVEGSIAQLTPRTPVS